MFEASMSFLLKPKSSDLLDISIWWREEIFVQIYPWSGDILAIGLFSKNFSSWMFCKLPLWLCGVNSSNYGSWDDFYVFNNNSKQGGTKKTVLRDPMFVFQVGLVSYIPQTLYLLLYLLLYVEVCNSSSFATCIIHFHAYVFLLYDIVRFFTKQKCCNYMMSRTEANDFLH